MGLKPGTADLTNFLFKSTLFLFTICQLIDKIVKSVPDLHSFYSVYDFKILYLFKKIGTVFAVSVLSILANTVCH